MAPARAAGLVEPVLRVPPPAVALTLDLCPGGFDEALFRALVAAGVAMVPLPVRPSLGVSRPRTSSACQQWREIGMRSAWRMAASVSTPSAANCA